jgi:hypothetical protein
VRRGSSVRLRGSGRPGAGRGWGATVLLVLFSSSLLAGQVDAGAQLTLEVVDNEDLSVRLRWTMSDYSEVESYSIFWASERFDSIEGMEAKSIQRGTTFLVPDLDEDVRYHFAVAAGDANGTVIAEGYGSVVPTEPRLKEVNYWQLMTVALSVTALFILGLLWIPKLGEVR